MIGVEVNSRAVTDIEWTLGWYRHDLQQRESESKGKIEYEGKSECEWASALCPTLSGYVGVFCSCPS